jgi:hypothetical protein
MTQRSRVYTVYYSPPSAPVKYEGDPEDANTISRFLQSVRVQLQNNSINSLRNIVKGHILIEESHGKFIFYDAERKSFAKLVGTDGGDEFRDAVGKFFETGSLQAFTYSGSVPTVGGGRQRSRSRRAHSKVRLQRRITGRKGQRSRSLKPTRAVSGILTTSSRSSSRRGRGRGRGRLPF